MDSSFLEKEWRLSRIGHDLIVDVKAVTLHRFGIKRTPESWEATVILDI